MQPWRLIFKWAWFHLATLCPLTSFSVAFFSSKLRPEMKYAPPPLETLNTSYLIIRHSCACVCVSECDWRDVRHSTPYESRQTPWHVSFFPFSFLFVCGSFKMTSRPRGARQAGRSSVWEKERSSRRRSSLLSPHSRWQTFIPALSPNSSEKQLSTTPGFSTVVFSPLSSSPFFCIISCTCFSFL